MGLEFADLQLPDGDVIELSFQTDTIPDGGSATSDPVVVPGDTEGTLFANFDLLLDGAVIVDGDVWDEIPYFAFAEFDVEGCIVPIVPPLPPAPPAPVAVAPAFTG